MKSHSTANAVVTLSVIVWLAAVIIGMSLVLNYQNTPGLSDRPPSEWPASSNVTRTAGMPTLVMMVHPHCPCSRASIGELAILMSEVHGLVDVNVVFVKPKDLPAGWEVTDLWRSAAMIPGVKVTEDHSGIEARLFSSQTSGQVMLYDPHTRLVFSGGITAARGHSGDNNGRSAIASLLTDGKSELSNTPVFGCPLFARASGAEAVDSCDTRFSN